VARDTRHQRVTRADAAALRVFRFWPCVVSHAHGMSACALAPWLKETRLRVLHEIPKCRHMVWARVLGETRCDSLMARAGHARSLQQARLQTASCRHVSSCEPITVSCGHAPLCKPIKFVHKQGQRQRDVKLNVHFAASSPPPPCDKSQIRHVAPLRPSAINEPWKIHSLLV
jgi:hypothetical protein